LTVDFLFSEEELLFQQTLRRYAEEKLLPNYRRWDEEPLPRELVREFAQLGMLGLRVPSEYGGQEASFVACGIAAEEVGRADINYTYFIQVHAIVAEILRLFAREEVKARWLPALARGEAIGCFCLTEPGMGSDAAALTTRARRQGDFYIIDGEKSSITLAGWADAAVVFARTGGPGAGGVSAFLVPLDLPGVSRTLYNSPGGKLSRRGSLFFDGVKVPQEYLLGEENKGFYQAMHAFDFNRPIIGLACLGAAQKTLEETAEYLKGRVAFGRPLAKFEGVSFPLAEHLTQVEAARLLCYKALWLADQGLYHAKEAAMTKWLGPKVAAEAIHTCLLLHGHYGYSKDLPLEQRLRDVMANEIADGTGEIMKIIVLREAFGREFVPYR